MEEPRKEKLLSQQPNAIEVQHDELSKKVQHIATRYIAM